MRSPYVQKCFLRPGNINLKILQSSCELNPTDKVANFALLQVQEYHPRFGVGVHLGLSGLPFIRARLFIKTKNLKIFRASKRDYEVGEGNFLITRKQLYIKRFLEGKEKDL